MKRKVKRVKAPIRVAAQPLKQGDQSFYLFSMAASKLWTITDINRRSDDKQEGYQRALSPSRVRSIRKYISNNGIVPGSIVVSFDDGEFDVKKSELVLPNKPDLGWVIDGQHRLAGAFEAEADGVDIILPVVAFLKLSLEKQIEFFITVNREAKSVPASLYIDLLKHLPRKKTDKELTDERIADITRTLNSDELSPFYQRIIFTRTAKAGEISLVNFARILRPHIARPNGILGLYTQIEQTGAINNYYKALENVFPPHFENDAGIFFKTVGFGAVWRAFPIIFNWCLGRYKAFNVASVSKALAYVKDFEFEGWNQLGSGTAAENQAGDDLVERLTEAFAEEKDSSLILKLD